MNFRRNPGQNGCPRVSYCRLPLFLKLIALVSKMKAIQVIQEEYEKAKVKYTQQIADLSSKPSNIDPLYRSNILKQLAPLLQDPTISVKNNAALTLGRLANHSAELAEAVVTSGVLPQLVISLSDQNVFYKKAACFVMREVAKHSPALAKSIVNCEALDSLTICLEEFDSTVKEAAASVISNIAKHSEELAQVVIDNGSVPPLVLALENPEPSLKKACAVALSQISKHSADMAEAVVDAGAVMVLNQLIGHHDAQLKRQVCQCLLNIAKHSQGLAQTVVGAELFPKILYRLKDMDETVRRMAAGVIRDVVKQSPELAKLYVESGGVAATIEYLNQNKDASSSTMLPGIVILGYIGAYDPQTALNIISAKGVSILKEALTRVPDDLVKSAASWTMSQIACHSPQHAKRVCQQEGLIHLLAVYLYKDSTEELRTQSEKSLKNIIKMCLVLEPLQSIINDSPPEILKNLLKQIARILVRAKSSKNQQQRAAFKAFAMKQGLKKIQTLKADPALKLLIDEIIGLYPQDIAQFYSPDYQQALINKVG